MNEKKQKQSTLQAFLITWPAPCRLELAHGRTSCCFPLCEIKHLRTIATCSARISKVLRFSMSVFVEGFVPQLLLYMLFAPEPAINQNTEYIEHQHGLCIDNETRLVPFSRVYSPGPPMLNLLFRAGSYYFWQKKIAAAPCEMYAPGQFSRQKEAHSVCSLGRELRPPHAAESNPRIFSKQGSKKSTQKQKVPLRRRTQRVALAKCRVTDCYSDTKNWCHQTMIQTTREECDTTSCRVSRHQFRLLEDRKRLNTFSPKPGACFTKQTWDGECLSATRKIRIVPLPLH